jgi:hypothetical protein
MENELLQKAEQTINNLLVEIFEAARVNFEDPRALLEAAQNSRKILGEIRRATPLE